MADPTPDQLLQGLLHETRAHNVPHAGELSFAPTDIRPGKGLSISTTEIPVNGGTVSQIILSGDTSHLSPAAMKAAMAYGMAMEVMKKEGIPASDTEALDRIAFTIDPDKKGISELMTASHNAGVVVKQDFVNMQDAMKVMGKLMNESGLSLAEQRQLAMAEGAAAQGNTKPIDDFAASHKALASEIEVAKEAMVFASQAQQGRNGPAMNSGVGHANPAGHVDLSSDYEQRLKRTEGRSQPQGSAELTPTAHPEIILSEGIRSLPPEAQKAALAYGLAIEEMKNAVSQRGETDVQKLDRLAYALDPDKKGMGELLQAAHDHPDQIRITENPIKEGEPVVPANLTAAFEARMQALKGR